MRWQVKKKMTSDEFVRNNRGINNGDNLPPDFLRSIYNSISRNEIRITSEAAALPLDVSPLMWAELQRAAYTPRGAMVPAPIDGARSAPHPAHRTPHGPHATKRRPSASPCLACTARLQCMATCEEEARCT